MVEDYSGLMSIYSKESPDLLRNAFDSILAQTILPKEFVCVLDGPIGLKLTEVVKWFKSECSNRNIKIVFVKNPVNCGLGISLAEGLRACSYEYIGRFDSDDLNNPERMEVMLNYMNEDKNQDIAVVGSQIAEFSDSPQRLIGRRKVPISFNEVAQKVFLRNPLNHMTVVFRKSIILAVDGYKDMPGFEDYYLWMRLIDNGYKITNVPDTLVYAHVDGNTYARRGGIGYLRKELKFQYSVYSQNIIGIPTFVRNIFVRGIVRLLPQKWLAGLYKLLH